MKFSKSLGAVAMWGSLLMIAVISYVNADVVKNPSWTVDDPVIMHNQCAPYDYYAAKDPTIVYFEGKYLVYYTGANQSGGWQTCFTSAPTIPELKTAKRTYVTKLNESYFCAPELFYFEPQKLWYLVYQGGTYNAEYATSTNPADPASWVGPKSFGFTGKTGWDYFVICDDKYAYMYNTPDDNSSTVYVRRTTLANFPKNWEAPYVAASNVFEAAFVYKSIADNKFYLLIEAVLDGRSYSLFQSPNAGGPWTLVNDKWATKANLTTYRGKKWTTNVSHGEFIRVGYNQKLEIADINKVDFLIQGTLSLSGDYQKLIWDLGLIRNYPGEQIDPSITGIIPKSTFTHVLPSQPKVIIQPFTFDSKTKLFDVAGKKVLQKNRKGLVNNNVLIQVNKK